MNRNPSSQEESVAAESGKSDFEVMILTYRFKLMPTKAQHAALNEICESQRLLYNADLEHRRRSYEAARERGLKPEQISYASRCRDLADIRGDLDGWFGAMPSNLSRWTLKRCNLAFAAFFKRAKAKAGRAGYPRFRSKERWTSFGFTEFSGIMFDAMTSRLTFKGLPGTLRVHFHRSIPEGAKFLGCVFRKEGRHWFVSIQMRAHKAAFGGSTHHASQEAIGIDMGVLRTATLSNGETVANPKVLKRHAKEIRRRQRALARCKRGSKRRQKVKARLASAYADVANARSTYAHQQTASITRRYALIAVEDLKLKNMTASARGTIERPGVHVQQKAGLNRAMLDVAPGKFVELLTYKAERAGGQVIKVDPRGTSIMCSSCGTAVPKELRVRMHACPACGLTLDRDVNAAINILNRALAPDRAVVGPGLAKPLIKAA